MIKKICLAALGAPVLLAMAKQDLDLPSDQPFATLQGHCAGVPIAKNAILTTRDCSEIIREKKVKNAVWRDVSSDFIKIIDFDSSSVAYDFAIIETDQDIDETYFAILPDKVSNEPVEVTQALGMIIHDGSFDPEKPSGQYENLAASWTPVAAVDDEACKKILTNYLTVENQTETEVASIINEFYDSSLIGCTSERFYGSEHSCSLNPCARDTGAPVTLRSYDEGSPRDVLVGILQVGGGVNPTPGACCSSEVGIRNINVGGDKTLMPVDKRTCLPSLYRKITPEIALELKKKVCNDIEKPGNRFCESIQQPKFECNIIGPLDRDQCTVSGGLCECTLGGDYREAGEACINIVEVPQGIFGTMSESMSACPRPIPECTDGTRCVSGYCEKVCTEDSDCDGDQECIGDTCERPCDFSMTKDELADEILNVCRSLKRNETTYQYTREIEEADGKKIEVTYPTVGDWPVCGITQLSNLFTNKNCRDIFNEDINNWAVSRVTSMAAAFEKAHGFNQPLDKWKVARVTNWDRTFREAYKFNQPLSSWQVDKATKFIQMFREANEFNGNIANWQVSRVTDFRIMFTNATAFNQPIGGWNMLGGISFGDMFDGDYSFNQDISAWKNNRPDNYLANWQDMFINACPPGTAVKNPTTEPLGWEDAISVGLLENRCSSLD